MVTPEQYGKSINELDIRDLLTATGENGIRFIRQQIAEARRVGHNELAETVERRLLTSMRILGFTND